MDSEAKKKLREGTTNVRYNSLIGAEYVLLSDLPFEEQADFVKYMIGQTVHTCPVTGLTAFYYSDYQWFKQRRKDG